MLSMRWVGMVVLAVVLCRTGAAQYGYGGGYGGVQIRTPFWQMSVDPRYGTTVQTPAGTFGAGPGVYPPPVPGLWGAYPHLPPFVPMYVERGVIVARPATPDASVRTPPAESGALALRDRLARLADAADALDRSLRRHPQGDTWVVFLEPATVREFAIESLHAGRMVPSDTLRQLHGHYQAARNTAEVGWLHQQPGFAEVLAHLNVLLAGQSSSVESGSPTQAKEGPVGEPQQPTPAPEINVPQADEAPAEKRPESRLRNAPEELPSPEATTASRRASF